MTLTILLAGTALAITAVFVMTSRSQERAALAGETTTVGLADAGAETLAGGNARETTAPSRSDWQLTTVSALSDAEDLLDYLENRGYAERELVVLGNSTFAIRWR